MAKTQEYAKPYRFLLSAVYDVADQIGARLIEGDSRQGVVRIQMPENYGELLIRVDSITERCEISLSTEATVKEGANRPEGKGAASRPEGRDAATRPEERGAASCPEERDATTRPEERDAAQYFLSELDDFLQTFEDARQGGKER